MYLQHGGRFEVASSPDRFTPFAFPRGDLAILYLKTPALGLTPMPLNELSDLPPSTVGRIVGFGYHNPRSPANGSVIPGLIQRTGIKIQANVSTHACGAANTGKKLICWTYQFNPLVELSGSTCKGDSGGPLLVYITEWKLAGVTSGGETCAPGDEPVDTEILEYVKWVRDHLKTHRVKVKLPAPATVFALQPAINDDARFLLSRPNPIFANSSVWSKTFAVDTAMNALRISVNATPGGSALHLTVSSSDPAQQCDQSTTDTAVLCEFASPPQGNWSILVTGELTQEYQVVATRF